jgi:ABC-type multidrug transport system ATPase subunit
MWWCCWVMSRRCCNHRSINFIFHKKTHATPNQSQLVQIRAMLGVCPQHDILFNELSAREHIELYAGLKGVPREYWTELFEERLKAVKLWTVRDVQAGTYSGGCVFDF